MAISTPIEELKNNYNMVKELATTNRNENKVTLNYSKLDLATVGKLKSALSTIIVECRKSTDYEIYESDNEVLDEILKQNTGSLEVTIDYDKIDTFQVKFTIKGMIQDVLKTRMSEIYKDILLNNNAF